MSRIINPNSPGKERLQMTRAVVLAIRELAKQSEAGDEARDLAAFISLALQAIAETIDVSVAAWEKRGYWVKADRFRMTWLWSGQSGERMRAAVLADDWDAVAQIVAQVAQKLNSVNLPQNHRLGRPWVGAWERLK